MSECSIVFCSCSTSFVLWSIDQREWWSSLVEPPYVVNVTIYSGLFIIYCLVLID